MKLYPYLFPLLLVFPWGYLTAADAEKQQRELQRDIRQLSTSLKAQKGESAALQDEVTQLEKKLGSISDKHYQTEKKIDATLTKLDEANRKKLKLETELSTQKSGLDNRHSIGEQSTCACCADRHPTSAAPSATLNT